MAPDARQFVALLQDMEADMYVAFNRGFTITNDYFRSIDQELSMRWRDALDSCKSRLAEEDRKIAESIISLEAVLQDLDERQKVLDNTWMGRTRIQLIPFLKCLQTFTAVLVVTMLPHSIETSLAWGLVSIVLRVSLPPYISPNARWCAFRDSQSYLAGPQHRTTFSEALRDVRLNSQNFTQGP